MFAGIQIIQIQPIGDVLLFHVVEIFFEFPAFEQFTDGQSPRLSFKLPFAEKIMRNVF